MSRTFFGKQSYKLSMIVAKFGGSSLSDARGFMRVAELVRKNGLPVLIASAPGGSQKITDLLIAAYCKWEQSGNVDGEAFELVCSRFRGIAAAFGINIDIRLAAIRAAINAGCGYDYAVSRGEYLCAWILAKVLGYNFVDAIECVKLSLDGKIDLRSMRAHSGAIRCPCVIPGFYGKLPSGQVKLLPRGGSDISGAAIAAAIGTEYQKWTDVDGIMDGHGGIIDALNYDEAELLCYFGATVMQYESISLLKSANVRLTVKGVLTESKGTTVSDVKCKGFAYSSKKMYTGGGLAASHGHEIIGAGLKIPLSVAFLSSQKILIDGCGFSPLALRRILCYEDIREVTAVAAIGCVPDDFMCNSRFLTTEAGSIFVKENDIDIIRQKLS